MVVSILLQKTETAWLEVPKLMKLDTGRARATALLFLGMFLCSVNTEIHFLFQLFKIPK